MPLTPHLRRSLDVFQNFQCRESAICTHDAAAGVRRGSAHIEVLDRCAVLRPPGDGPQEEQLFEGKFTLEDVALAQAPLALEIERRDDLRSEEHTSELQSH